MKAVLASSSSQFVFAVLLLPRLAWCQPGGTQPPRSQSLSLSSHPSPCPDCVASRAPSRSSLYHGCSPSLPTHRCQHDLLFIWIGKALSLKIWISLCFRRFQFFFYLQDESLSCFRQSKTNGKIKIPRLLPYCVNFC